MSSIFNIFFMHQKLGTLDLNILEILLTWLKPFSIQQIIKVFELTAGYEAKEWELLLRLLSHVQQSCLC